MPHFISEGHQIAYQVAGTGPMVVLIHGFASNGRVNWIDTGWVDELTGAGYRVAVIDNRGHGNSAKIHDPAAYAPERMAADALNLVTHLGAGKAAFVGYSMGARIAAFAAIAAPGKVAAAVFGGLGISMVEAMANSDEIIAALAAPNVEDVASEVARSYRVFADQTGSDREALAACMQTSRRAVPRDELARLQMPVLVAVGSRDDAAGAPEPLAALMPHGEAVTIAGRDHMRTSGDAAFKQAVLAFFDRVWPATQS